MYTKGEYDSNLKRIMGEDIPTIRQNIYCAAKYYELQTQLNILDRLREFPDLESEEEYKRDLKALAERAGFKFGEDRAE